MANRRRRRIARGVRRAVYQRDNWTCQYCGRVFEPCEDGYAPMQIDRFGAGPVDFNHVWLELDHIHPLAHKGLAHSHPLDGIDNLLSACSPCNRRKSAFLRPDDWANKFAIARQLLTDLDPSQHAAERVVSELIGAQFRIKHVPQSAVR